jgi:SHS family lactate transporter-like MFS transporter
VNAQVSFLGWAWDAFDFFSVTLVIPALCDQFGKSHWDIVWGGLTLPLMVRVIGATMFGLASDRLGRKWPFIVNAALLVIFEMATGFCADYGSFVACRILFGIAMGGLYGNAASTALEDCPEESRGLISGMFQVRLFLYQSIICLHEALRSWEPCKLWLVKWRNQYGAPA